MVRYVGKSNNPKMRFSRHINDPIKTYKSNWVNYLISQGKLPVLQIIEETDIDHWEEAEKRWIIYFRKIYGDKLTNTTDGGECGAKKGCKGHPCSEEVRKKISEANKGRHQTEEEKTRRIESLRNRSLEEKLETRRKRSEAMRGRVFTAETRKKISESRKGINNRLGYKHSQETKNKIGRANSNPSIETRRKLSEKMRGRKHSEETLKKMSLSNIGKHHHRHTLEARKKIAEYHTGLKHSEETKKKMSETKKNFFMNNNIQRVYDAEGKYHYAVLSRN
jgi:hypothetical protein